MVLSQKAEKIFKVTAIGFAGFFRQLPLSSEILDPLVESARQISLGNQVCGSSAHGLIKPFRR